MAHKEYAKGYNAGKRFAEKQLQSLSDEIAQLSATQETKDERVFMRSFEIALANCSSWEVAGKKMVDMASYCKLARIMTDNAIKVIKS